LGIPLGLENNMEHACGGSAGIEKGGKTK